MTLKWIKLGGASLAALAFIAACDSKPAETPAPAPAAEATPPPPPAPDYVALLTAADRPTADAADDAARKPADVMAFTKVMTGQTVLEIEAGGGYYTELMSHAVGPTGKVIMQNPNFGDYGRKEIEARLKDNRLPNVTRSETNFDKLEPTDGSVDVVTWFLGPHELFFKPKENPAGFGDPAKTYAEIFRVLKPGGTFVILDHAAKMDAPATTGNDIHRISPMLVKSAATAAGFVLEEESQALANPADDHTKGVFDPAIRRHTDQFLLRYKKPG
jgi:predicted methyltransferase